MPARKVHLRCYLMGQEIKVKRVSVSSTMYDVCTATIDIEPSRYCDKLLPMMDCLLAVQDPQASTDQEYVFLEGVAFPEELKRTPFSKAMTIRVYDYTILWRMVTIYMLSLDKLPEYIYEKSIIDAAGVSTIITSQSLGGRFESLIKSVDPDNFAPTLLRIIDLITTSTIVASLANNRTRTLDRVAYATGGENFKKFITSVRMREFLNNLRQAATGETTAWQFIVESLMSVFYQFMGIPAPALRKDYRPLRDASGQVKWKKDKTIMYETTKKWMNGTFFMAPTLLNAPPPTCNILFPNQYSMNFGNRNWVTEPTRYAAYTGLVSLGTTGYSRGKAVRPVEVGFFEQQFAKDYQTKDEREKALKSSLGAKGDKLDDGTYKSTEYSPYLFYNNEELMRGSVPRIAREVPGADAYVTKKDGKKKTYAYAEAIVDFEFQRALYEGRSVTVTGNFNIRPIVGAPIALLTDMDNGYLVYGLLTGMEHTVDYDAATAVTAYQISFARNLNEEDINRPVMVEKSVDGVKVKQVQYDTATGLPKFHTKKQPSQPFWLEGKIKEADATDAVMADKFLGGTPKKATLSTVYSNLFGDGVVGSNLIKSVGKDFAGTEILKEHFLKRKPEKPPKNDPYNFDDNYSLDVIFSLNLLQDFIKTLHSTTSGTSDLDAFVDEYTKRPLIPIVGFDGIDKLTGKPYNEASYEGINGVTWISREQFVSKEPATATEYTGPLRAYNQEKVLAMRDAYQEGIFDKKKFKEASGETYDLLTEQDVLDMKAAVVRVYREFLASTRIHGGKE